MLSSLTVSGDLNINGDTVIDGFLHVIDDITISGGLDLGCNSIIDVSSISFCNGFTMTMCGENIELSGTILGLM